MIRELVVVGAGWREVVQALVVSLMIVVSDEGFNLGFKIARDVAEAIVTEQVWL